MNNMRRLLPAAALLFAACATTTPAPVTRAIAPQAKTAHPTSVSEYRIDLEKTYEQILVHEGKSPDAPAADLEAGASIPIPEHRTIRGALNLFTTDMHDDIQTSLIRSARYRRTIEAALAQYRLPKGLAYLPVIESAYLPSLTSRAGAHGIWQFMPDTAREYGLRVDWWVDERADPEQSAHAAAAYLNDLYRDFNDWPLALAAYNAGPGRIRRAIESTGASSVWELIDDGAIPKETRGYVPTFYATLIIATDPSSYGFRLGEIERIDEQQVVVEGPLSLAYVADVSGVDRDTLREMNPALRRGLVPPGRYPIHVPSNAAEQIASRARTMRNDDSNIAVCSFRLRDGDNVKRIARAIGTTTETILAMNALRSVNSIGEGDSIYLPVRSRDLGSLLAHANDATVYYKVRKGDTFYSIARRHGLSVEELRDMNDLSAKETLHPGQRLRVSPPRGVAAGN